MLSAACCLPSAGGDYSGERKASRPSDQHTVEWPRRRPKHQHMGWSHHKGKGGHEHRRTYDAPKRVRVTGRDRIQREARAPDAYLRLRRRRRRRRASAKCTFLHCRARHVRLPRVGLSPPRSLSARSPRCALVRKKQRDWAITAFAVEWQTSQQQQQPRPFSANVLTLSRLSCA